MIINKKSGDSMKKQSLTSFLREDEKLILPVSKNKLISTSNNVFVLDKSKDLKLNALIEFNINELSKHPNKPYLMLISNQSLSGGYGKLKEEGYEVLELDFFNKESFYMIDPFILINKKIDYVRKLKSQIQNKRGKYLGIGETFISHLEVRNKIQKCKEEIKKLVKEFVNEFFIKIGEIENEKVEEILICIITCYCDDCIEMIECPYKLTYKLINKVILDRIELSKTKLKKYILNERDEIFLDKEIIKILSNIQKMEYSALQDNIKKVVNKNILKEKKIDLIELKDKKKYFITINDKNIQKNNFSMFIYKNTIKTFVDKLSKNKLCVFLSNIENIEKYEYLFKIVNSNIKIFISTNSITDKLNIYNDYINAFYKTKLLIGDTSMDSLKEMMLVCKLPVDDVLNVNNKNIYRTIKRVKKINHQAKDILFLNEDDGFKVMKYKYK